jgi:hypothetical protein
MTPRVRIKRAWTAGRTQAAARRAQTEQELVGASGDNELLVNEEGRDGGGDGEGEEELDDLLSPPQTARAAPSCECSFMLRTVAAVAVAILASSASSLGFPGVGVLLLVWQETAGHPTMLEVVVQKKNRAWMIMTGRGSGFDHDSDACVQSLTAGTDLTVCINVLSFSHCVK